MGSGIEIYISGVKWCKGTLRDSGVAQNEGKGEQENINVSFPQSFGA